MSTPSEVTKSVGIGIVGIGFMGMIHYVAARKLAGGRVTAICSRDRGKLAGDWSKIKGNFGPSGTTVDTSGLGRYADAGDLLNDPGVDLVDLCVPNDEHARLAIRALEAGKHVLVEKPIALTTEDADAMVAAAKMAGKMLMVAHVLPFFPEFAFAAEAVASGRYGKLRAAHFTRTIARPDWSAGIGDAERSGGPAIDLHIHDAHFVGLVCGPPRAVRATGVVDGGAVAYLATQYLFGEGGPAVSANSGAISQPGRPFAHGYEIYLERATLAYGFADFSGQSPAVTPLSVVLADGTVERPEVGSGDPVDAFADELADAVAAVESGVPSPRLSGELARRALVTCHAEVQSVRTGETVRVD